MEVSVVQGEATSVIKSMNIKVQPSFSWSTNKHIKKIKDKCEYQGEKFPLLKYKQTNQKDKCEYQDATLFIPLYNFKQAILKDKQ